MSVAEFPPRVTQPPADAPSVGAPPGRFALTLEQAAYLGLFALALLFHLWGLGDRALHHDETLHASYSWYLFKGRGFMHDPLLHGPFLYHIVALTYFLFGDSDYTARLSVALFGSALVLMPYLIRRELGRGAALLAAVYLLISPAFLYIGRFIRHDMYAVTFEMLGVISVVRYASTRQKRWLYIGAAALGLMATTMETFYLYLVIVGTLLGLVFLWRIWRPGVVVAGLIGLLVVALVFVLPGQAQHPFAGSDEVTRASGPYVCPSLAQPFPPDNPILYTPGPVLGLEPLATADNSYALCVRNEYTDSFSLYFIKLGQFFGHPAIVMALVVSLAGLTALYALIWRRRDRRGTTAWQRARAANDGIVGAFASLGRDWRVLIALAIFLIPYTLLFTAFFVHPTGIVSGTTGSLLYWLAQHDVKRGGQPNYYYLILLTIYEPLALLWGSVGLVLVGVMAGRRILGRISPTAQSAAGKKTGASAADPAIDWRFAMPVLLAWWAIVTLALYSWAGEKMPWLTIHVALPIVLLGAWAFGRTLRWWLGSPGEPMFEAPLTSDWQPAHDASANGNGHTRIALAELPRPGLRDRALPIYLAVFGSIAALCFLRLTVIIDSSSGLQSYAPFILPGALLLFILVTIFAAIFRGPRWAIGALALAITLLISVYTARSAYQLNYRWGDVPRELMIFVQTSPDVARVVDKLEQAATRRNGQFEIWYDNETVWQWYMRRFEDARQQPPVLPTPPGDDVKAVLMLQENIDGHPENHQNLAGFRIQRYPLRWWIPESETYRLPPDWRTGAVDNNAPLLMRLLRNPFDGETSAQVWQYLIYRQLPAPVGSTDFVLAIRPEIADEIGIGTGAEQGK
jgi:hypothetical protein